MPSTVGNDGRNYANVNGQGIRYVLYSGRPWGFQYEVDFEGEKLWINFEPLSDREASHRRLRVGLNAIDDFRNFTAVALVAPFLMTGIGEQAFRMRLVLFHLQRKQQLTRQEVHLQVIRV